MKRLIFILFAASLLWSLTVAAQADLLHQASLKNGNYGDGARVDTLDPIQGDSPHVLGIIDSPQGVTYTATETNGSSNAMINWTQPDQAKRMALKNHGTISFRVKFDRQNHVGGWIIGENYGYDKFSNGQGAFGSYAYRMDSGTPADQSDDQVMISWSAWFNNVWYYPYDNTNRLDYGRWHYIGYTWGGPDHGFEIWVNHKLISAKDLPAGVAFPWGQEYDWAPSGYNVGLGCNHQRGYQAYSTASGVTFADLKIWNEYRPFGDTVAPPNLPPYLLLLDK
jgi:hypothetical protein